MRGSSDIEPVYRELLNSDFVSLFAATNPFDGFAEILCDVRPCRPSRKALGNVQLWKAGQ